MTWEWCRGSSPDLGPDGWLIVCPHSPAELGLTSELLVERVNGRAAFDALAFEWADLHAQARPRLPFTTLRWLSLWWKDYGEQRALIHDEFFAHTLRNERGSLVAVAPLMLTARPGRARQIHVRRAARDRQPKPR